MPGTESGTQTLCLKSNVTKSLSPRRRNTKSGLLNHKTCGMISRKYDFTIDNVIGFEVIKKPVDIHDIDIQRVVPRKRLQTVCWG